MYDWEIDNFLKTKNYNLTPNEYLYLCSSCPQIVEVKFSNNDKKFHIRTEDSKRFSFYIEK